MKAPDKPNRYVSGGLRLKVRRDASGRVMVGVTSRGGRRLVDAGPIIELSSKQKRPVLDAPAGPTELSQRQIERIVAHMKQMV